MHRIFNKNSDNLIFWVYLTPGASRNCINGLRYENTKNIGIKISVRGKPVENHANTDLIKFIASTFSLPKSRINIISGSRSRHKKVCLYNFSINDIPPAIQEALIRDINKLPATLF